jgi:hypothetical protein
MGCDHKDDERDFAGFYKLKAINKSQLNRYLGVAKVCGITLKHRGVPKSGSALSEKVELWVPDGEDLTSFWSKLII